MVSFSGAISICFGFRNTGRCCREGNAQLWNPNLNALQIVAHRGFDAPFLQQFNLVHVNESSACARAFRLGRRVMIHDVMLDRFFEPYVSIAQASGYRAVQSTPILRPDGVVIGVLSTHFADTHEWVEAAQHALDQHASQIAALVTELDRKCCSLTVQVS